MTDARHDSTANAYHSTVACLSGRCAAFLHVHIEILYLAFLYLAYIPRRNVGGIPVTHGEHRHSLQ